MLGFRVDEVVAARDAARRFSALMERLRDGQARRFIIVFRNRPHAVVLAVSEYERLIGLAGEGAREAA
jgi:prevent-host-death family protein